MVYDGQKTVAAAGTREPLLAAPTRAYWVIIQGLNGNGNAVFVGGTTIANGRGWRGLKNEVLTLPAVSNIQPYDLSQIYVDVAAGGEGVSFLYAK